MGYRTSIFFVMLAQGFGTPTSAQTTRAVPMPGTWPTAAEVAPEAYGAGPRLATAPPAYSAVPVGLTQPSQQATLRQPRSTGILTLGALGGGAVGFVAGALVGAVACDCNEAEGYDELWAGFLGATAGVALGIPIATHLANGRRGNLAYSLAASLGIAAAGVVTAVAVDDETASPVIILAIPVSQIVTSLLLERKTTR